MANVIETIRPINELFQSGVSAMWATTYNIDLELFNEFLLRYLGAPPLNVVVLSDQLRLANNLERLSSEQINSISATNSAWLLRGVRSAQSFHPKTYLTIIGKHVKLLVGSGNLSYQGLNAGHEVFTLFNSGTKIGDEAIAIWHAWMHSLVGMIGDVVLADRMRDLEEKMPVSPPAPSSGPLLHNLKTPIAEQFTSLIAGQIMTSIDDVLITAPFYDASITAVEYLLRKLNPRRVIVYITGTTNVDGLRLIDRIESSGAAVQVRVFKPDVFVHAKLVGVTSGSQGWLLSGSANLSEVALVRNSRDGNVELAVFGQFPAEKIPEAFVPQGMTVIPGNIDDLKSLSFELSPEGKVDVPPINLMSATALSDGRVAVQTIPTIPAGWFLSNLTKSQPLCSERSGRLVTEGALPGRLVLVTDESGKALSNRVIVDNPDCLSAMLKGSESDNHADTPPELIGSDLNSPIAKALLWLHQHMIMDLSDRLLKETIGGIAYHEKDNESEDDLWERLEREKLERDPRVAHYRTIWSRSHGGDTEPILELFDKLSQGTTQGSSARLKDHSLLAHILRNRDNQGKEGQDHLRKWKISSRVRIRTLNLLRRWANAQDDERFKWIDPLAPATNFAVVAGVLVYLHIEIGDGTQKLELTRSDLNDIWLLWLRKFVGSGKVDGWLDRLEPTELAQSQQRTPDWVQEAVAALCWLAVPLTCSREQVIEWQPVIRSALEHGLVGPTEFTATYLSAVTGIPLNKSSVDDRMFHIIDFLDDDLWCSRTCSELDLVKLELYTAPPGVIGPQLRLIIDGISDPLLDSRVPRLIIAVRHYRGVDGVALHAADSSWRIAVSTGDKIAYLPKPGPTTIFSTSGLEKEFLETLSAKGGVLTGLFSTIERAAYD
jgi:hypothetical protein